MPEGPEVQIVVNKLKEVVLGKQIENITVKVERIIRTPDVETFLEKLVNEKILDINRQGKHIIFVFDNFHIVSHLRMEGKYEYIDSKEPYNKHDHVIFHFTDGMDLRYNDVRKFGTMDLVNDIHEVKSIAELGPDPLSDEFSEVFLKKALKNRKTNIKRDILSQQFCSDLGNIYCDEVCFEAGIHPERASGSLTDGEIKRVVQSTKSIIKKAIELGGSSIRTYESLGEKGSMQELHKVYGKTGEPCMKCGTPIEKIRVAGRGTHICPNCQK